MKNGNSNAQARTQGSVGLHEDSLPLSETASDSAILPKIALVNENGYSPNETVMGLARRPLHPVVQEMLQAFEFMKANEDVLDQKVAAFIRGSRQFSSRLIRIARLGMWYMEDGGTRLVQCCVVRLFLRTPSGSPQFILKEFAIPVGDPAVMEVSVRKDKG